MREWLNRWIATNWGTKVMAAGLALLLWMYLHEESTDSGTFPAAFLPRVENRSDLSRLTFLDAKGDPLGDNINITVTGPKGDLRNLTKKGIRCEPSLDPSRFNKPWDTIRLDLQVDDLNLPEALSVDFGSFSRIQVQYVRFKTVVFDLAAPAATGRPIAGYQVGEVTVRPSRVQVRFPADHRPELIRLEPVLVDNRASSFNVEAKLDREGLDPDVTLLSHPLVDVTLVPEDANFQADVLLHLSGPSPVTSRLELLTTTIKVTVIGSENAVQAIRDDASNLLYAFVVVQIPEAQLEVGKQFSLSQVHCVLRESRYAKEVRIVPMSDIRNPDNREVIVTVMK